MLMRNKKTSEDYMRLALGQAKKAGDAGDVPIGCVIVYKENKKNKKMLDKCKKCGIKDGDIISRGYNKRNAKNNSIYHSEIIAIDKACEKIKDWRLDGCEMYVTLEPCQMCAGAIVQSRIKKVYIAARSKKSGSAGSIVNILQNNEFNHKVDIEFGLLEEESSSMIKKFFKESVRKN